MPWPVVYIAVVTASPAIQQKILDKHGVTFDEVKEAVVLTMVQRSGWNFCEVRGWRLFVTGWTYTGRRINVILYPIDVPDGTWDLGTAMPAD